MKGARERSAAEVKYGAPSRLVCVYCGRSEYRYRQTALIDGWQPRDEKARISEAMPYAALTGAWECWVCVRGQGLHRKPGRRVAQR